MFQFPFIIDTQVLFGGLECATGSQERFLVEISTLMEE